MTLAHLSTEFEEINVPIVLDVNGCEHRAETRLVHFTSLARGHKLPELILDYDKDVLLAAVQKGGYSLEFASENLKNNKDIVLAAVSTTKRQNAACCALRYAPESLQDDKEFVLATINARHVESEGPYRSCLEFASDNLKNDKEVAPAAVEPEGDSLRLLSEDLRMTRKS